MIELTRKRIDLTGQRFSRLVAIKDAGYAKPGISGTRQMQIAVALMYGYEDNKEVTDDAD